jgi:integrase
MKVSFYLLDKRKDKTSLMFNISYAGKQIKTSTKINVPVSNFNYEKQQIVKHQFRLELNQKLNYFKSEIERYCLKEEPSHEQLKEFIKKLREGKKVSSKKSQFVADYLNEYIQEKSKLYSYNYIKKIEQAQKYLQGYQEFNRAKLQFGDMNEDFKNDFFAYLNNVRGLRNSTINKNLQIVKTFLHWTAKKGFNKHTQFIYDFKINSNATDVIALNEAELSVLESIELKQNYLSKSRDLFLMQIYTGLRYSDIQNIKEANIDKINKTITIYQLKTKDNVIIPVNPKLEKLLIKYNYEIPVISNQKYNNYIKEVCKIAGIDTPVQVVYFKGKERIEEIKPKYELISSHTARRTFITISLKRGLLPETVMKVSGHKDRKSFQKYVRIAKEEAVEDVRNIWS